MQTTSESTVGKGQRAYHIRKDTGKPWQDVAQDVGSASPEAAVAGAKKYATGQKPPLAWPIRTIRHKAKAKAADDVERAQATRDARVYQRVRGGTAVADIEGLTPTNVYKALDRHCARTGDPVVARNAERAYRLRAEQSLTWGEVADALRYGRENAAIEAARGYANSNDLPWPPQVATRRRVRDYVGKSYYEAYVAGSGWNEVALDACKHMSYVKSRAKVYAEAHNLDWPV